MIVLPVDARPLCVGDRVFLHVQSGSTMYEFRVDIEHEGERYRDRRFSPMAFAQLVAYVAQQTENLPTVHVHRSVIPGRIVVHVWERKRRVDVYNVGEAGIVLHEAFYPIPYAWTTPLEWAASIISKIVDSAVIHGDHVQIETTYPEDQKATVEA